MDAKGRSIDNIVIERFWRTLKYENVYPSSYSTIKEARAGIDDYIKTPFPHTPTSDNGIKIRYWES